MSTDLTARPAKSVRVVGSLNAIERYLASCFSDASVYADQRLGATHWFSRHKLEEWNTDEVQFVPLESVGVFTIYRIQTQ